MPLAFEWEKLKLEKVVVKHYVPNHMLDSKWKWLVLTYIDKKKIIQMLIIQLIYHLQSANQMSSPKLKHYSRHADDKFKMPKFSRGHNSK